MTLASRQIDLCDLLPRSCLAVVAEYSPDPLDLRSERAFDVCGGHLGQTLMSKRHVILIELPSMVHCLRGL